MKSLILINNYKKALEQKYNAICFDIDGTLTKPNSKEVDERAINMIADLLFKKVPVVFITGRGETGLNDLINDIYPILLQNQNLKYDDLKRMFALTNDGARLFFTTENHEKRIFNKNVYISSALELEELNTFNDKIISILDKQSLLNTICKVTHSFDAISKKILNIRLVFEKENKKIIENVIDIITTILTENNFNNLVVTQGVYKEKNVIQIGTTKKELAIERAEKIIGVPKNSMLRIGDCGDKYGNDYSMLNCEQGFSVNRISETDDTCFPVFDENGNILKGVNATLYLVKNAKLLPTVCLESANKLNYTYQYAHIEKDILKGRKKYLKHYDEIVNDNFDIINGIDDLYDRESGSIKIPMYEWELIDDNNPLKQLWNTSENAKFYYSLRDNNNYLLRGSKTYYFFLANRKSQAGNDFTSYNDVVEWYNNYLTFFKRALTALDTKYDFNNIESKKMILGLLDNIRNILLILINHNINSKYFNENLLINLNSKEDNYINQIYEQLYFNDYIMALISFEKQSLNKETLISFLSLIIETINNDYGKFIKDNFNKDYSKEFRTYREIDNFAENYITIKLNNEKSNKQDKFCVCGMCYGGLELPIIYKILNKNIDDILLLKFNKNVSGYSNKQLVELRKFNINNYGGLLRIGQNNSNNIILLDDNILTGKTIQLALNTLYDENFNVTNICIVRYPSINRVDQMFMNNHGAVDYNLFFDYITGLCFPSPYSWRDENEMNPYLDSLGVFDLNRKKIIECLIKNHDYKDYSEVNEYKRRLIK